MKSSAASKAARAWSPVQSLGDWLVAALLSLANLLAVGVLAAAALGARAMDISLVAAFVAATLGSLLVAWLARAPAEIAVPAPSTNQLTASPSA